MKHQNMKAEAYEALILEWKSIPVCAPILRGGAMISRDPFVPLRLNMWNQYESDGGEDYFATDYPSNTQNHAKDQEASQAQ